MHRLLVVGLAGAALTAHAADWTDMIKLSGRLESDLRFDIDNYRGENPGDGFRFSVNRNDAIVHVELTPFENVIGVIDARLRFYGFNEANNLPALADRNKVDPFSVQLDQAYVGVRGVPFPWLDIKGGRMQLTWGSADIFNQVDFANSRDFYDPMDYARKVPNEMIGIDIYPESWLTISAVWIPVFKPAMLPPSTGLAFGVGRDANGCLSSFPAPPLDPSDNRRLTDLFGSVDPCSLNFATPEVRLYLPDNGIENSQVAVKAQFSFENLEFGLHYYRGRFGFPVAYNAVALANVNREDPSKVDVAYTAEVIYPRIQVAGLDFAYSAEWMFDIGLVGEIAVIFPEQINFGVRAYQGQNKLFEASSINVAPEPFIKATVGLDYTFTKWLYVNAMYLRGFFDEFNDKYGIHNYVVATAELKFFNDTLLVRLAGILNVDDLSNVANPQLTWVAAPGVEVLAGAFIFGGSTQPRDTYDYAARSKFGQKAVGQSFAYLKMRLTF